MLFFGLLIFLFLIIIRPQDFVPMFHGKPLVFILMGVLLIGWVLSPIKKKLFHNIQDKFVILFLVSIVISTVAVHWVTYSVNEIIETLKLALIYFFIVSIINNDKKMKITTWVMISLMSVIALMGILKIYGYNVPGIETAWANDKQVWQIVGIGIFDNPNDLAYSIVLVVPFALGLLIKSKNVIAKTSAMFLLVNAVWCIYLTRSRGGMLALVTSILIWLYCWISNVQLKRIFILFGIVAISAAVLMQAQGYQGDASSIGRIDAWSKGMSMVKEHPIIGVGKDRFLEYHEIDSHSSYVRAAAELGMLGLYAWIGIVYFNFKFLQRLAGNRDETKWKLYSVSYITYIGSYACASIFSTRTYDIVFLVVVAIISSLERITYVPDNTKAVIVNKGERVFFSGPVVLITLAVIIIFKLFLIQT